MNKEKKGQTRADTNKGGKTYKSKGNSQRSSYHGRNRRAGNKTGDPKFQEDMGVQTTNDAKWYSKNPQLNKDSASFNFSMALGLPINLTNDESKADPFTLAGVMAIDYVPGIGWCGTESGYPTTVDLAANSLYSFVVHANSRTKLYDAPDYMMYCLAGVDLYAAYADMVRAYGVARWYNSYNRYYPAVVLKALGYDLEEIISNMANFRYQLNRFAVALTSINIPNELPIYSRQTWLPQNLFMDHPGMKSQTYAFVPAVLHNYEGYSSSNGGYLHGLPWKSLSLTQKLERYTIMLNTLLADQDIGIMSGDTLKAFGPDKLLKVNMIGEDYTTIPVYDETVLMQIENLTICGGTHFTQPASGDVPALDTINDIWQNPSLGNRIFYVPTLTSTVSDVKYCTYNKMINIRHDNPSVDDLFEATRFTVMGNCDYTTFTSVSDPCGIPLDCVGTEIVTNVSIYNLEDINNPTTYNDNRVRKGTGSSATTSFYQMTEMSTFRHHPILMLATPRTTPSDSVETTLMCDVANYTILDYKELNNMHSTALLSQFGIPFLGSTGK